MLAAVFLLVVGCFGGGDDDNNDNQACATFSDQAVRDYCEGNAEGDTLDCTDFASSSEATRFVQAVDAGNQNRLEKTGTVYCDGIASANGTPASTGSQPAPTDTPPPEPTSTPAPTTYTIQPGDNPTLIAQSLGVPEDQVDAWVADLLALNGVEATALQVGQTLDLPPFEGGQGTGTLPANTGDPGGATGPAGPAPEPTATTGAQPEPTSTPPPADTAAPTTAATATGTAAPANTAAPTNTPAPTNTAAAGGTATFNIVQHTANAGDTINYEGTGFTPDSSITIELYYQGIFIGSEPDTVGPTGAFSGAGQIPEEASAYPGTYTIKITDSTGKTASDSIEVQ